ncbi:MAG: endolytic transglycosylase MltG [Faecalibacterium sp.]
MSRHDRKTGASRRGGCLLWVILNLLALALLAWIVLRGIRREVAGTDRAMQASSAPVTVTIEPGSGMSTIARSLKDAGVIRYSTLFRLYAGWKGTDANLQYGTFTLSTGASYDELLDALSEYAKAASIRLTFPEGVTAQFIAQKMEAAGLCTAKEFLTEACEGDFSQYRFWQYVPEDEDAPNRFLKCEGYLFPDTYEFLEEDTVHNYVATFYAHFDAQLTDTMYNQLEQQKMTLPELITLASLVQEEAGNSQNDNVAQVFRNRLADGSPYPCLQSNTSSYIKNDADNNYLWNWVAPYFGGWDEIPQNIVAAYDTYRCTGLPAGPISNPGLEAIKAALDPHPDEQAQNAYFFVTDLAGNYYYGRTLAQHNQNCAQAAKVNRELKKAS